MQLFSTWTKIRFKRDCAFFHDSWRHPLIDVDVATALFILIDVDVAIIQFIYCSNSQFQAAAAATAAFLILNQIPCNYWQKKSLSFFRGFRK